MENVDIGGVSLIRASAKNAERVAILTNKNQYAWILDEMKKTGGSLSDKTRDSLAIDAFKYTSEYDTAIYNYLRKRGGQGRRR